MEVSLLIFIQGARLAVWLAITVWVAKLACVQRIHACMPWRRSATTGHACRETTTTVNLVERVDVSLREFVDGLGRKSGCIFDRVC